MLRRDVTFLNHGSFGACPRPVFETYQRWQHELEAEPVEFLGRRLPGLLAEARGQLAEYLGAQAEHITFVPNATHGMNIVARSLSLEPSDEVLGTDHEYGAVERTWRFVCEQRGARYRSQRLELPASDADALVNQLWEGVTERTRVIVVSHITSPTALILPVAQICQRAAAQGIITVIDGAHAPGQIELALDALNADFYTGNCHKWLCAPKGAGFLYARSNRRHPLKPLIVSWGWNDAEPSTAPLQDYFEWVGTDDPSAYLSVPAAIEFLAQHDWPNVRANCHRLAAQARERIGALTGLPQISPDTTAWWSQMCVAPLPTDGKSKITTGPELQRRLWEDYQIEVPITSWDGQRFVRISIQAYNAPADVDRLVAALAELI